MRIFGDPGPSLKLAQAHGPQMILTLTSLVPMIQGGQVCLVPSSTLLEITHPKHIQKEGMLQLCWTCVVCSSQPMAGDSLTLHPSSPLHLPLSTHPRTLPAPNQQQDKKTGQWLSG